ncbi:MAG: response regulator [Ferruginibacter sp.]
MTFLQRKILCVDDDVDDLSFLTDAIHDIDPYFEIVELKNGQEAITYLDQAKQNSELPCLVLLDINMPLLDGKQTLEKIRTELDLKDLPVVMLTSSQNPNDKILFRSKGVQMYTKPTSISELHSMVKSFLLYYS